MNKAPGQREERYAHLLCGPVDPGSLPAERAPRSAGNEALESRIDSLEARIEALERSLASLGG